MEFSYSGVECNILPLQIFVVLWGKYDDGAPA